MSDSTIAKMIKELKDKFKELEQQLAEYHKREPYIINCIIISSKLDRGIQEATSNLNGYLFDGNTGQAYLDGYAIIPREDYDRLNN